ncbi:NAD(P)-dependent oxidoreductase [Pseudorhodoferax aquiterrae]|uniref:NAD(P)-dependent oxidoreductase n=1 Tax=Pseudorhodoferax aquiterrae TaxID=747304 RepID=A0ABQ3G5J9_9BURK|nr:SDR family oxidoreductase [Pseudorhodoferax aquiterrae]GHC87879.1 NAD(P)-dependent oxidoreductase [Pseudorhodoferax aquiterrae]
MRLQGKRVLVTAAGQGIGRAAVEAMAREGAEVWATDVNAGLLEQAYGRQAMVHTQRLDVLDKQAIAAAVAAMPGIDVLFNCAGVVHNGPILDATDDDLAFALNLNVRAQFWAIQAALPRMLDNDDGQGGKGRGSIINMASVCSSLKGLPNRCVYGTSKAAVIGLTKSVAADYVARGIRCNAIAPGTVDTPSLGERINAHADPVEARKAFVARQPMGRLAQASEIVPIVTYLASDESVFATGQVFSVDGGMTI